MNESASSDDLQPRMIELESLLAHQQRLIEQLDEALREHHVRLTRIERRLSDLGNQLDRLDTQAEGRESLPDEKPPHY